MIKKLVFLLLLANGMDTNAQLTREPGSFELGMRSTVSLFGSDNTAGFGTGGQFRIMLGKKINTEWFADYIQNDLEGLGKRTDAHIGWSVMFYLLPETKCRGRIGEPRKISPYLLAGHCFDHTKVTAFSSLTEDRAEYTKHRWSSAAQAGLGAHYYIGKRMNLSASAQYMLHLGNDIHAEVEEENGVKFLHIEEPAAGSDLTFEGHLLLTVSLNFKIADLW